MIDYWPPGFSSSESPLEPPLTDVSTIPNAKISKNPVIYSLLAEFYEIITEKTLCLESDVRAVIEGIEVGVEGFRGLERADVQRVRGALLLQSALALGQRRTKEWIAVGGENDFPGTKIEGDDADVLAGDVEAVDDAVRDVLLAHRLNHMGDDEASRCVVLEQRLSLDARGQLSLHPVGSYGRKLGFVGLGVVVQFTANETLAVAHHPYLAVDTAVDNGGARQPVLGVFGQPGQHRFLVVFADVGGDARQELLARGRLRHVADKPRGQLHSVAPVRPKHAVAILALRRAAVNHGDEVICDDDAVLAFLPWVLRDEVLLDYFHVRFALCTRRNTAAAPTSRPANAP